MFISTRNLKRLSIGYVFPNIKLLLSEKPWVKTGHVSTYIFLNSNTSYLDNT